jgi:dTDP-4-amino-4,6-dideoxygalactose transaminase
LLSIPFSIRKGIKMKIIPFTRPYISGNEEKYIKQLFENSLFAGNGHFSRRAEDLLMDLTGAKGVFLTSSGTAALELMCLAAGLEPGDEVILPSFTYPSTANAILRVGAVPVFVDIRSDTFNLVEKLIERAITEKTRALIPVHYGGVACEMEPILHLAYRYGLLVLEDAAQGIDAWYGPYHLGVTGQMGALSFHETKNIHCGQGGALLIRDKDIIPRVEILFDHGTNRRQFLRGEIDHYFWKDAGSSFSMSEVTAAFLCAQLESVSSVTEERRNIRDLYHEAFAGYEKAGFLRRPLIPQNCRHNGHCYPLIFPSLEEREKVRKALVKRGIMAHFHYVPLHSSPMGMSISTSRVDLPVTDHISECLLRMPLYSGLPVKDCISRILEVFDTLFQER